jgi:uncharacterized protein
MKTSITLLFIVGLTAGSFTSVSGQQGEADRQAIAALRTKAEHGDAQAQCDLGVVYAQGARGVTKDANEAVKWYRKAAEQKLAAAQFHLGDCYEDGAGVTNNYAEASKWYRKAAEQHHVVAQGRLGIINSALGVNETEALKWIRKAADENDAKAQDRLGYCYWLGLGVTKDSVEAWKWCYLAATQGHKDAKDHMLLIGASPRMTRDQLEEAFNRIAAFNKQLQSRASIVKPKADK